MLEIETVGVSDRSRVDYKIIDEEEFKELICQDTERSTGKAIA